MILRSGLLSLGGTAVRAVVQIAANVVVARLLGPDAYGTAAAVLALAIVLELVRNGGFAAVVLRSVDPSAPVLVALHRSSTLVGVVLGAAVALAGCLVLWAAPEAPYGVLLLAISGAFPLAGFVAVPIAGMVRRHRMGRVVAVESAAVVAGAAAAIALGAAGVGAVALIAQVVTLWVVVAVGVVALHGVPRGASARWASIRSMAGTARDVSLVQAVSLVARAGDRVLVTVFFGPGAAGLYVQAMQLMALPLDQIGAAVHRVAVPVLAAASGEDLRRRYRQLVGTVTLLAWPVLAVLGVLAEPVVRLLFGVAWVASSELLPFLAVAGGAQALGFTAVWYFVASGRAGRQVRWALVSQPVVLGALFVGTAWGVGGIAAAFAVASVVLVIPAFLVSTRGTGMRLHDLLVPAVPAAAASLAAALVAELVRAVAATGPVLSVLVPGAGGAAVAVLVAWTFPAVRRRLRRRPGRPRPLVGLAAQEGSTR